MYNIKTKLVLSNAPVKYGKLNIDEALRTCGQIAGVCYDKEGLSHLKKEPIEKTNRRINMTLENGHHSVYDHISITLNISNIPKILAMVLNNEKQYTTSEKSARYTKIEKKENTIITDQEEKLYNKWIDIFDEKIKETYGNKLDDKKIKKLAQENARYLVTVFMPTEMVYTTTLRQINYIVSWMKKYINESDKNNNFERKLTLAMQEFITSLEKLNIMKDQLMKNEKNRSLSLFDKKMFEEEYFGSTYITTYKGSFAQLAQAQRHRTIDYKIKLLDEKEYFVPPILEKDTKLVEEWIKDMKSVSDINPQGELVLIKEMGTYEKFIEKTKERLCTHAQLEIMRTTKSIEEKYAKALNETNHPYKEDIKGYTHGARCTFKNYTCNSDCKFCEGKNLERKI